MPSDALDYNVAAKGILPMIRKLQQNPRRRAI